MLRKIAIILLGLLCYSQVFAQIEQDTIQYNEDENPDLIIANDTIVPVDSALIREQFIADSLRQVFVRDSLIAREKFVRDSLYRRKLILDSVVFLQEKLPMLIEAAIKSVNEEIVVSIDNVDIIGDSTLSGLTYRILEQNITEPYAPWRSTIELSGNEFKVKIDTINKKVLSVRTPKMYFTFDYGRNENIVRMDGRSTIVKKQGKNYYKFPIDTVFFDYKGRVKQIRKYVHYYEATNDYKKGAPLYLDLDKIKEFEYFPDGVLKSYKLINYCERWSGKNENELCHSVTYTVSRDNKRFTILRKNEPENVYSDGTLIFEFDDNFDLKYMEFKGRDKNLNKKCIVELNKDRYVSRYLYEKNGIIDRTLLINYYDDPNAKYKVETILCHFEDDGISYYQKNNTTGKSRTRDKLTMKWGPWQ